MKSSDERQDSLILQRDELLKENQELKTNLVSQVQSFNQLEIQTKKLQKNRAKLLRAVRTLSVQNKSLSNCQTELFTTQKRLEQSENDVQQLQLRVESISELNAKLSQEITESQNTRQKTMQEFEEITESVRMIRKLLRPTNSDQIDHSEGFSGQFLKELSTLRDLLLGSHADIEELIRQRTHLLGEITERQLAEQRIAKINEDIRGELETVKDRNEQLEKEVRAFAEFTAKYEQDRQKLSDAIATLRKAVQITKESLTESEQEKKLLKEENVKLKILLEQVRDVHNLSIQIPD
jgi:chromosome segregation ATPase